MKIRHLVLLFPLLAAAPSQAEILYNPAISVGTDRAAGGVSLTKSKVGMQTKSSFDIERTILGFEYHYGISQALHIIGQAGYATKVEYEDIDDTGHGYILGGGVSWEVHRSGANRYLVHGVLNYLSDDVHSGDLKTNLMEIHMGGLATHAVKNNFEIYGGLDLVPYSDGDLKIRGFKSVSVERDTLFNLRLGMQFLPTPQTNINFGIAFISETTLNIGVDFKF